MSTRTSAHFLLLFIVRLVGETAAIRFRAGTVLFDWVTALLQAVVLPLLARCVISVVRLFYRRRRRFLACCWLAALFRFVCVIDVALRLFVLLLRRRRVDTILVSQPAANTVIISIHPIVLMCTPIIHHGRSSCTHARLVIDDALNIIETVYAMCTHVAHS